MTNLIDSPVIQYLLKDNEEIEHAMLLAVAILQRSNRVGDKEVVENLIRYNQKSREAIISDDIEQATKFIEYSHRIIDDNQSLFTEIDEWGENGLLEEPRIS